MDLSSFSQKLKSIAKGKNGIQTIEIFNMSGFFAHDSIRIWMFLPVISNRIELKAAIRTLDDHGFVSYSEKDYSFVVCEQARLLFRDELNRAEREKVALKKSLLFLKTAKPSYYSHFVSVYLHAKQYPDLFKLLDELPGNMLRGMVDDKKDSVAVQLGREWSEFMTKVLGTCHWTVLHLRSIIGLALLEGGARDSAVKVLVDVYHKTCISFNDIVIGDIELTLAEAILRVDPTNKQAAEDHLRQVFFAGKNVSDCKNISELEEWICYANLIGRFGMINDALLILNDVITCRRRLFGPRDEGIYDVMQSKAQLLTRDSKNVEALKILKTVEQRRRKSLGVSNPKTLEIMNMKGSILILQDKLKQALNLFDEVVTRARVALGEDHQLFLYAKTEMVKILMLQKNFDQALELSSGVQDKLAAVYGVVHPQCFTFRKHMAVILWEKSKHQKALRVYKDLLDDFENSYEHEVELKSLRNKTEAIESELFTSESFPLHSKVKNGCLREVIGIANSRNVDFVDKLCQTALHYASAYERVKEARVLLEKGAIYNYVSLNECSPLDLAKEGDEMHELLTTVHSFFEAVKSNKCDDVVELASKEPCVLGATDMDGGTPLLIAIRQGNLAMLKALLDLGADPRGIGNGRYYLKTSILIAAEFGHVKIAEKLLEVLGPGALGPQDNLLTTPLHSAAEGGHLAMARFLLARGAVYCAKNWKQQMARQVAKNPEVTTLLLVIEDLFKDAIKGKRNRVMARLRTLREEEKEAVAGAKNDKQRTLLQVAMREGNVQLVKNIFKGLKRHSE